MNIFFEIHSDIPREGPGDNQSTTQASAALHDLPTRPRVLDIGCGPGMQTLQLASLSQANILAVDTHRPFLERLKHQAETASSLAGHITPVQMSMYSLGLAAHSFDLIWSEGAIYIIGFEAGLQAFRRLLRPAGYLAATELSWLKDDPPAEIKAFWETSYPGMKSIAANRAIIQRQGYAETAVFTLPESSWLDEYYLPLENRIAQLRQKYLGNPEATRQLDMEREEIDLYHKYSSWYGYVFYVMQKKEI